MYSHNMRGEKEPNAIFEDGWHQFEVVDIKEEISKNANEMFVISLALSSNPRMGTDVYAIAVEGKRWFLKMFLDACGIQPDEAGDYNWDKEDVIGKNIEGLVENQEETWLDRNGNEKKTPKSKIIRFR